MTQATDAFKGFQEKIGRMAESVAYGTMDAKGAENAVVRAYNSSMSTLDQNHAGDKMIFSSLVRLPAHQAYLAADKLRGVLAQDEDKPVHLRNYEAENDARTEFLNMARGIGHSLLETGLESMITENNINLSDAATREINKLRADAKKNAQVVTLMDHLYGSN